MLWFRAVRILLQRTIENMKKILIFIALALPLSVLSQLIPLSKWDESNRRWRSDISEVAYISTRCASNFDLVGNYFVEKGVNEKQRASGNTYKQYADKYISVALKTSKITNMDEKAVMDRYKSFLDFYLVQITENKKIHNNIFMGIFLDDFDFCGKHFPFTQEIDKTLN